MLLVEIFLMGLFLFSFLKIVAGYDKPVSSSASTFNKRLAYVRGYVKLISIFANKYKSSVPSKEYELSAVISFQLNHLDSVVCCREEMTTLINELLCVFNIPLVSNVALQCFNKWLGSKSGSSLVLKVMLQCVGATVNDRMVVGELCENALLSYFQNGGKFL